MDENDLELGDGSIYIDESNKVLFLKRNEQLGRNLSSRKLLFSKIGTFDFISLYVKL